MYYWFYVCMIHTDAHRNVWFFRAPIMSFDQHKKKEINFYVVLVFVWQFWSLSDIHAMNCNYNLSIIDKEIAFQKGTVRKSHFDYRGGQEFRSMTVWLYIVSLSSILNTQSWSLASNHKHRMKAVIPSDWFGGFLKFISQCLCFTC